MRRPLFAAGLTALVTLFCCMCLSKTALLFVTGAVFLSAAGAILSRRRRAARLGITVAAVWAVFLLLFTARLQLRVLPSQQLYGARASVEGTLEAYPESTENAVCYTLRRSKVGAADTPLTLRVYAPEQIDAAPGDTVRFSSVKFFSGDDDSVFYYHSLSTGAWLSAYGRAPQVTRASDGRSLRCRIAALRHKTSLALEENLPSLSARVADALFTGESRRLPADFKAQLRTAGASHIFAVSGMHLSLWTAVLFLILQKRSKTKVWANIAAAGFVLFYMVFTGCSPSVLRAGIMLLAAFLARIVRRYADPLNTLGLAALAQLLPDPFLAGNVSFLLSFFATAAIFILFPFFNVRVQGGRTVETRLRRRLAGIPNGLLLSLCVLFFTVPASSVFFTGVSLLSPLSSALGAPPAEGVMLTAAAGLLFGFCPPVSRFFFRLCGVCCAAVIGLTDTLSDWDFALCPVRPADAALWYAGTLFVFLAAYFLFRKNSRVAVGTLVFSASLALLLGSVNAFLVRDRVELYLPPAGNAVSAAVVFGGSTAAQIGTGERYESAAATAAFLSDRGVTSVKTLIVPADAPPAAGQLRYFSRNYALRSVFSADPTVKDLPPLKNDLCANAFSVSFRAGVVYENFSTPAYTAGRLSSARTTAVFSFSPADDFSGAPAALKRADLLVCRGGIPKGLDPADFARIVVMTDKSAAALRLPENAVTTADTGGVVVPF